MNFIDEIESRAFYNCHYIKTVICQFWTKLPMWTGTEIFTGWWNYWSHECYIKLKNSGKVGHAGWEIYIRSHNFPDTWIFA
jgi:hypothetical protein